MNRDTRAYELKLQLTRKIMNIVQEVVNDIVYNLDEEIKFFGDNK